MLGLILSSCKSTFSVAKGLKEIRSSTRMMEVKMGQKLKNNNNLIDQTNKEYNSEMEKTIKV